MIICSACNCHNCVCGIKKCGDALHEKCWHCGMIHEGRCPEIKSIEYYPDGTIKKVEYIDKPKDTSYWNR